MQGCFSFIRIKSVEGTSNPSVFAALSQHPSATIDGRLPRAHENLAAFPESPPQTKGYDHSYFFISTLSRTISAGMRSG